MQILEKCMEDMKAVYKLNEEKLDFNLRVLGEREKVNSQAMTTLKKKVQRQKENYRIITKRYYKENQEFKKTNAELTQEYKRITRQFKELQLKFKKFEKSDESRFNEIWSMNEQEVRALINKIIQADRVIHVQQLGIPWTPPSDALFGFTEGGQGGSQLNPNTSVVDSSKHGLSKSEFIDDQSVGSAAQGYECKVSIKKIKNVFKKLIEEVPFLIDDKVLQECEGKSKKEQFTLKIDGIRKSLDIDNMEDVELLVQTFYDFSARHKAEVTMEGMHSRAEGEAPEEEKAPAPAAHRRDEGEEGEEGLSAAGDAVADEEILQIDMDDVIQILRDFQVRREERINDTNDLTGNPRHKGKKRSTFETEEQKKERFKKQERVFWEKMTTVLSDSKLSVWRVCNLFTH